MINFVTSLSNALPAQTDQEDTDRSQLDALLDTPGPNGFKHMTAMLDTTTYAQSELDKAEHRNALDTLKNLVA